MAYTFTLQKLSENLQTTYENTIFKHSGDIGDSREKEVINYLLKVMAHKYGFQSGEVFDKNDANSGQTDVIIYDNLFSVVFTDGTDKIMAPIESTYGIVSVKSLMGTKELGSAIDGIKKYNQLERSTGEDEAFYITPDLKISSRSGIKISGGIKQKNINCIFAFDTNIAVTTMLQTIKDAGCVDLVVIPKKICILGRPRNETNLTLTHTGEKAEYTAIHSENSVSMFVMLLQIYLAQNRLIAGDIFPVLLDLLQKSKTTSLHEAHTPPAASPSAPAS